MSKSWMSPVGRTELVSAILSQNGHGSHSHIRNVSHVCFLMTFTPDLPSTIVLGTSRPLTMTVIAKLLVSTTINPSSRLEKKVGVGAKCGDANTDFSPSVNQGTNCNTQPNGSVIWQSCNACHIGSSSVVFVSSSENFICSRNSVMFRSFAFSIHSVACFRIASSASHSVVLLFDQVVTC
mgnify:CR=1 FL=1